MPVSSRPYLSIGDVLTLLRQEFPDVTISKIRFLESQGLVNPERTPSGYRKFYEPDVERLRWVLRQQREHFLPLKVIKGRLEEVGEPQGGGNGDNGRSRASAVSTADVPAGRARADTAPADTAEAPSDVSLSTARRAVAATPLPGMGTGGSASAPRPGDGAPEPGPARHRAPAGRPQGAEAAPAKETTTARAAARAAVPQAPAVLAEGDMTLEELASASGAPRERLMALETFGLISGRVVGGVCYYGEVVLEVARLAQAFAAFGVEPRHLRLHKHAAEREAGFVEQVVLPLLKQRNPESRQRAHDTVSELSRLGQELRAVLLARALRDQLGG